MLANEASVSGLKSVSMSPDTGVQGWEAKAKSEISFISPLRPQIHVFLPGAILSS